MRHFTRGWANGELDAATLDALGRLARDRDTELLYDEVDVDPDGRFVHRLLFWPREETSFEFGELRIERAPRTDRRVELGGAFAEIDDA